MAKKIPSIHSRNAPWATENPADNVDTSSGDTDAYRDLDPTYAYKNVGDSSLAVSGKNEYGYSWEVHTPLIPSDTNLGKSKFYESTPEEDDHWGDGPGRPEMATISGTTKTLKRGQIAAEAMHNRLVEGRNPRTGRPTK